MARLRKSEEGDDYITVQLTGIENGTTVINFYIKESEDEEFDFDDYIDFVPEVLGTSCYYTYEALNSDTEYTMIAAGYPYGGASKEERTFETNKLTRSTKPPLPDEFEWDSKIEAGAEIYSYEDENGQKYCEPLTAQEWMKFLQKVVEIANYKNYSLGNNTYQYLVAPGEEMKPGKVNAVVNMLKMLSGNMESPFTPAVIKEGSPITAGYFMNLQYYINDVIGEL